MPSRRSFIGCSYSSVVYFIVDGVTVAEQKYYLNGTLRHTLKYLFDENQRPVGVSLNYPSSTNWTNYYFVRNLQGDVEQIVNASGAVQAIYTYGKLISTTNGSGVPIAANAASIANYNPFRYREYYYDVETGFYYLQSRYYDPAIGRFLNADVFASTGQSVIGFNMFAYCGNDPTNRIDPSGKLFSRAAIGGLLGAATAMEWNGQEYVAFLTKNSLFRRLR